MAGHNQLTACDVGPDRHDLPAKRPAVIQRGPEAM